jgi:hypothetical protein
LNSLLGKLLPLALVVASIAFDAWVYDHGFPVHPHAETGEVWSLPNHGATIFVPLSVYLGVVVPLVLTGLGAVVAALWRVLYRRA